MTTITVEVDIDQFDTDNLIEELSRRGHETFKAQTRDTPLIDVIEKIYLLRRIGADYQQDLDKLIYLTLGKVI